MKHNARDCKDCIFGEGSLVFCQVGQAEFDEKLLDYQVQIENREQEQSKLRLDRRNKVLEDIEKGIAPVWQDPNFVRETCSDCIAIEADCFYHATINNYWITAKHNLTIHYARDCKECVFDKERLVLCPDGKEAWDMGLLDYNKKLQNEDDNVRTTA